MASEAYTYTHTHTHTHTHAHTHTHTHTLTDESDYKKPGARRPQAGAPGLKSQSIHELVKAIYLKLMHLASY